MKNNRKGFTLVELVIVIAVIAILAGVIIGTFASVVNRAKESAKVQEMKNAEIAQKAEDILKKIDDANWYGWEDFETSIVEKMTQVIKANPQSASISAEDLKVAVKAAIKEYADNNAQANTSLTEEQVRVIVEDAIGKINYNGVTEAQVRAIVLAAANSITATQLNAAQVRSIVNAAAERGLTATQVAQVIGSLDLATVSDVDSAVSQIKGAISSAPTGLTAEELEAAIVDLLPVTYKVANSSDLAAALESVNSFSTLNFTADYGPVTISLSSTDNRTLTITGVKLENLTVSAPVANIYLLSDSGLVKVTSVADHSFHVFGNVETLELNKGRVVVESGALVEELVAAPAQESLVSVVIDRGAVVTELEANYQKHDNGTFDWIEVENNGAVGTATLTVVSTGTGDNVTTNVKVIGAGSGIDVKAIADETEIADLVISNEEVRYTTQTGELAATEEVVDTSKVLEGKGTADEPYFIRTVAELKLFAALINSSETYNTYKTAYVKLTSDLDISDITWTPISREKTVAFKGTFDGNKKSIVGLNNKASFEYVGPTEITVSSGLTVTLYGLFNYVGGTCTIKDLNMVDIDIDVQHIEGSGVAAIVAYAGVPGETGTDINFKNITVSGKIVAFDNAGAVAGRCLYNGCKGNVTFDACTNNATIITTREDKYARAGSISGQVTLSADQSAVIKNCVNNGTITILKGTQSFNIFAGHLNCGEEYTTKLTLTNNVNNGGDFILRDAE